MFKGDWLDGVFIEELWFVVLRCKDDFEDDKLRGELGCCLVLGLRVEVGGWLFWFGYDFLVS